MIKCVNKIVPLSGVRTRVCKVAFASILGISKCWVERALQRKTSTGAIITDQRGKHQNQPKVPVEVIQRVIQHVNSFPTEKSHYSR